MTKTITQTFFVKSIAAAIAGQLLAGIPMVVAAELEQVVVTAEKREESLQNTPISLLAFDAVNLEKQGLTDLGELPRSVPNLQITPAPSNAASLRIFIRGVGNFDDQLTQDPSVAVYTDGVYMARSQGLASEVADLERIEVLRGPQGTLYGRNATGGAINFITKAPQLGVWGFSESITAGSYDERRSRTMVNAPLGDTVALRLTYAYGRKDGFVKNEGTGADTFGEKNRNALRADVRWVPNEQWDIRYTYDQSRIKDTALYFTSATIHGDEPRPTKSSPSVRNFEPSDITSRGHQLTANWKLADDLTFKSISAYRKLDNFDYQDYLTYLASSGASASLVSDDLHQEQWSQEFQLLGNAFDDKLEYIAGLYYFRETGDGFISSITPGFGFTQLRDFNIENTSNAIFGQATYTPTLLDRRLHLTLGLRESKDRRKADLSIQNITALSNTIAGPADGNKSFSNFSPSFTAAFDVTDTVNVYAKVARGYKSGGFNVRPSTLQHFDEGFGPEKLTSYELGAKSEWWERRLRLNAAIFHSDYDDIQVNAKSDITNPSAADIINAGKATIDGVEMELTALLTDDLTVNLNYAYLDARYRKIEDAFGTDVTSNYVFVNAPHNSYVANIDYTIATTAIGQLSANVGYSWRADAFTTVATTAGKWKEESYGLLNARLTLAEIPVTNVGKVRASLWGKNLEDKKYSVIHAPGFNGYRAFGDPRSVGIDVVYEY